MKLKRSLPLLRAAREVSFNSTALLLIFLFLFSLTQLPAQTPDYNLNEWVGSNFKKQATPFFKLLTLQTSHTRISYSSPFKRVVIGFSGASGIVFGNSNLAFITGKTGLYPSFEGNLWISSNLRLKGQFSGFVYDGDIVISSGYGVDLLLNSKKPESKYWLINFQKGGIEGTDDFFVKTVGIGIFRGIYYLNSYWWLGFCSDSYNAGIHIKNVEEDSVFRRRLEGQINTIKLGMSKMVKSSLEFNIGMGIHPSFMSIMIGIHKIIG